MAKKKDAIFMMVDNFFKAEQLSFFSDMDLLPDSVIRAIVSCGSGEKDSQYMIHFLYQKEDDPEKRKQFLKEIYRVSSPHTSGRGLGGFWIDSSEYAAWVEPAGISIACGKRVHFAQKGKLVSWDEIDHILSELVRCGNYLEKKEIEKTKITFVRKLAESIGFMLIDVEDDGRKNYLPVLQKVRKDTKWFDPFFEALQDMIMEPSQLKLITEEMKAFASAVEKEPKLMRHNFYNPKKELWKLELVARKSIAFAEKAKVEECRPCFITDDEVIGHFITTRPSERKYEIYLQFLNAANNTERAKYLQHIKGTSGGGGSFGSHKFDAKGFTFKRRYLSEEYAEEHYSWQQLAGIIESVIKDGCYITEDDCKGFEDYVKRRLSRSVYGFFYNYRNRNHAEYDENYSSENTLRNVIEKKDSCIQLIKVYEETLEGVDEKIFQYGHYKETLTDLKDYTAGTYLAVSGLPVITPL